MSGYTNLMLLLWVDRLSAGYLSISCWLAVKAQLA